MRLSCPCGKVMKIYGYSPYEFMIVSLKTFNDSMEWMLSDRELTYEYYDLLNDWCFVTYCCDQCDRIYFYVEFRDAPEDAYELQSIIEDYYNLGNDTMLSG